MWFILLIILIATPAKAETLTKIPKNTPVLSRVSVIPGVEGVTVISDFAHP
jgi:hypothetical protein